MDKELEKLFRKGRQADVYRLVRLILYNEAARMKVATTEIPKSQLDELMIDSRPFYSRFSIPKKSGGERHIDAPHDWLKVLQRALIPIFEEFLPPTDVAFGFLPGRSILQNADRHAGAEALLNVDIEDFFPSISTGRLVALFQSEAGGAMSVSVAIALARICTKEGRLPQGAPSSPILTNLVATRMDSRLNALAQKFGCVYSRYVDDLTFSADGVRVLHRLFPRVQTVLGQEGFLLNPKKSRYQRSSERQEVTGLVLSASSSAAQNVVSVNREYRRKFRAALHLWATKGIAEAARKNGFHTDAPEQRFIRSMAGRCSHIIHVRRSPEVLKMRETFRSLVKRDLVGQ